MLFQHSSMHTSGLQHEDGMECQSVSKSCSRQCNKNDSHINPWRRGWSVESFWISHLRSVLLPFASPTIFVDSWNSKGVWLRAHLCRENKKGQNVGTWWHPAQITINKHQCFYKNVFLYLRDVHICCKHLLKQHLLPSPIPRCTKAPAATRRWS